MEVKVVSKSFTDLATHELYGLLRLRSQVFVLEQNSVYLDIDGKDPDSFHLFLYDGESIAAYSRILPAGLSFAEASFGRVLVSPGYRGKGLGYKIVEESIKLSKAYFGNVPLRIGAQHHLQDFYGVFGFVASGTPYDEDGILHIEMTRLPVH